VTQIGKIGITRQCGVCGRTLLLGEQVEDFTNGVRRVSVCTLCLSEATARGWLRAGAPAPPPVEEDSPEAGEKRGWLRRRRGPAVVEEPEPEPDRSLPVPAARALERGVDAFNASAYRRTVASIAKSFGVPRASVVVLSGNRPDHTRSAYQAFLDQPWQLATGRRGVLHCAREYSRLGFRREPRADGGEWQGDVPYSNSSDTHRPRGTDAAPGLLGSKISRNGWSRG